MAIKISKPHNDKPQQLFIKLTSFHLRASKQRADKLADCERASKGSKHAMMSEPVTKTENIPVPASSSNQSLLQYDGSRDAVVVTSVGASRIGALPGAWLALPTLLQVLRAWKWQ